MKTGIKILLHLSAFVYARPECMYCLSHSSSVVCKTLHWQSERHPWQQLCWSHELVVCLPHVRRDESAPELSSFQPVKVIRSTKSDRPTPAVRDAVKVISVGRFATLSVQLIVLASLRQSLPDLPICRCKIWSVSVVLQKCASRCYLC